MARVVTITLDDTSGELEMGIRIPEGYTPDSQACQMANMIVTYLDSIADRRDSKMEEVPLMAEPGPGLILTV